MSIAPVPVVTNLNPTGMSDIQHMMYAFGDARRPLATSAEIVDKMVISQIMEILHRAADVAYDRNAKTLCIEDIIFLMRRDPVKVQRLIKYLSTKEQATKAQVASDGEIEQHGNVGKRCKEFIEKIDQGGKLMAAFNEEYFDEVYMERLVRNDKVTRTLDEKRYVEFCHARKASFRGKHSQKFQQIIQEAAASIDLKMEKQFHEILLYLARETVGQIVSLALTVRRDGLPGDNISRIIALGSVNPSYPSIHLPTQDKSDQGKKPELTGNPLTPAEIREAMRRIQRGRDEGMFARGRGRPGPNQLPLLTI